MVRVQFYCCSFLRYYHAHIVCCPLAAANSAMSLISYYRYSCFW